MNSFDSIERGALNDLYSNSVALRYDYVSNVGFIVCKIIRFQYK